LGAVVVIVRNTLLSLCGRLKKPAKEYREDFINAQRDNLDWAAFIVILFLMSITLISVDNFLLDVEGKDYGKVSGQDGSSSLQSWREATQSLLTLQYIMLGSHAFQVIFQVLVTSFLDHEGKVVTRYCWVWLPVGASYIYVIVAYLFTDLRTQIKSK